MIDPTDYLRLTLDPIRLAVLGSSATGPVEVSELAEALDVSEKTVLQAVGRLRESGLLTGELKLDRALLASIGSRMPDVESAATTVVDGPWSTEERQVLARFFQGSRLVEIPGVHGKRRVILERVAQEFEPGVRYDEREVNRRLQVFHPDYAALRRYLVDEGLMARTQGSYWRTGGRYDPV